VSAVVAAPAAAAAASPAVAARRATLTRFVDAATGEVLSSEKSALPPTVASAHARWQGAGAAPPLPRLAALGNSNAAAASKKAKSSSSEPALQVATAWSDHALTLASGRLVAWLRDEGLGALDDASFFDLPTARQHLSEQQQQQQQQSESSSSSPHPDAALHALGHHDRLRAWLRLQYVSALVQLHIATPAERQEQRALRGALSDRALPYRDPNGLRKLVVAVSGSSGRAVALHNGDGHLVWEHALPPVSGAAGGGDAAGGPHQKTRLATWRTFHDTKHAPQVAVVRMVDAAETVDGRARARVDVLDAHTGAAAVAGASSSAEFALPAGTEPRLVPLPFTARDDGTGAAAAEQRVFLLLAVPVENEGGSSSDDALSPAPAPPTVVAVLPSPSDNPAVLSALKARRRPAPRFWLMRGGSKTTAAPALEGYEVVVGGGSDAATVSLARVWRTELPGPLLALAARPPGQPLHSAVKVLGDRTLRVKHTDPNTLVAVCDVALSNDDDGGAAAASGARRPAVEAVVVDAATGRTLHRALHPGGRGPASAVASEHWVAYAFEDTTRMRHQLSVAELYSRAPVPLSLAAAVSGAAAKAVAASGGGGLDEGSADAPAPPHLQPRPSVVAQSFYAQRPVTGLTVTSTAAGITPQQLLVSTADGRVAAVDRRLIDARRPVLAGGRKPPPAEQEEGLIPYQDTLPVWGAMHATYDRAIPGLRGVAVAPADLESVCLIFARGSDLFATRLAPAKHFDALEPDFNYALLVAALLALAVGAAFARYSSRRAVVKAKWQ
jgi:hypothetical protein